MEISKLPAFRIIDPEGNRSREEIHEFPYRIGRQAGNQLVLRDPRISRYHAQVTIANGEIVVEDLASRHGLFVNGERCAKRPLKDGDRVDFGFSDSFALVFEQPGGGMTEIAARLQESETERSGAGSHLARLRAVLEVARALQSSFSLDSVLRAVVDAALVITGAERGFLLLTYGEELDVRCAQDRRGPLRQSDLKVPLGLIRKALEERGSTYSMQFDPNSGDPSASAQALELKSAVCIPLVRIRLTGESEEPPVETGTLGVIYLDSRLVPTELTVGSRELLETLAIEASTILENARLLEEDRARRHIQEELSVARGIQQSLLPPDLPETGWLRAAGYSKACHDVGGDYYDVVRLSAGCWAAIVVDVSGKGVSSALVASFLQGAFLTLGENPEAMRHTVERINAFFQERTSGHKHATLFCSLIDAQGRAHYINAGHCAPLLVRLNEAVVELDASSVPVGLLDRPDFTVEFLQLEPSDRLLLYTDGLTEAENVAGEIFGRARLREVVRAHADKPCRFLQEAVLTAVQDFTGGREQLDDVTLVVLEYRPESV